MKTEPSIASGKQAFAFNRDGNRKVDTLVGRIANIYEAAPFDHENKFSDEESYYIATNDCGIFEWLDVAFKRRCDASRWAHKHGMTVEHWYLI